MGDISLGKIRVNGLWIEGWGRVSNEMIREINAVIIRKKRCVGAIRNAL
jgi:hypothetical protein